MKTITVRDIRQRWPEAESMLQDEKELLITRDGKPVARLVRVALEAKKRARFTPARHQQWQASVFGGKTTRWVDEAMKRSREDRALKSKAE